MEVRKAIKHSFTCTFEDPLEQSSYILNTFAFPIQHIKRYVERLKERFRVPEHLFGKLEMFIVISELQVDSLNLVVFFLPLPVKFYPYE